MVLVSLLEGILINKKSIHTKEMYDELTEEDSKFLNDYIDGKIYNNIQKVYDLLGETNKNMISVLKNISMNELLDIIKNLEIEIEKYNQLYSEKKYLECYKLYDSINTLQVRILNLLTVKEYRLLCNKCFEIAKYIDNSVYECKKSPKNYYKCKCN